jgi:hypothetical protein
VEIHSSEAYSEFNPSEVPKDFWIFAKNKRGLQHNDGRSGKWLIFADVKNVDDVWAKIKKSTEEGRLGDSSKVAAGKPRDGRDIRVICVYTHDWNDEKDVRRVREELRKLGIAKKIPYKADKDTLQGNTSRRDTKRLANITSDCSFIGTLCIWILGLLCGFVTRFKKANYWLQAHSYKSSHILVSSNDPRERRTCAIV